ncbi:TetR/AcrR family transcriptional regulator [Micromonospora narathiwatensis]|uniref:Transcriptional regulator, TetR family n=1 Tax=Micromonospora narathiwatensis TaxID=299146 RepID=A0A1A9AFJ3_9ACTN|nr:TetR/AcrR family transcriptional regulator [Micromonospora narathiwatensis]SBT54956.1 transcriptional regulator, TetR family [Micromonospora narathiwatensis]
MAPQTAAPARGTRPRNRRALILAAATDLFHRRGYDRLTMGDLAEAVGIGPSALYRHFSGKQHLLREVLTDGLAPVRQVLTELDVTDRAAALRRLGALAVDHRPLGVLWQREARHLTREDRTAFRGELHEIGALLTGHVRALRPALDPAGAELLAWSMIGVLTSISFHRVELPRPDYDDLLAHLAGAVLDTPLPAGFTAAPPPRPGPAALVPASRREALLNEAVRMFAVHGFTEVGIEEIAAAVGITGPSVYHHFPSKLDLLVTALRRGAAVLLTDLSAVHRTATSASDGLGALVRSYLGFTRAHHELVDLLITEVDHLPDDERRHSRQTQRDYLDEWVHLLRAVHPGLEPAAARIRVQAVLTVANDAARTPRVRANPALPAALEAIATRLLHLPG